MSKTCLDCSASYELEEKRCPKCGSTNFVGGTSSAKEIDKLFAQFDSPSSSLTKGRAPSTLGTGIKPSSLAAKRSNWIRMRLVLT
jgi:hypothetical protein